MNFSQASLDFLAENKLQDSRQWFKEHKDDYERLVLAPMQELVTALTPTIHKIDERIDCTPKVGRAISRIYRDTRFSRDKSIYRAVVWCVFMRDKKLWDGLPGFFAEVTPSGYRYGCGYYKASAETLNIVRDMILAGDRTFLEAKAALDGQQVFTMLDERYKRSKYPDQPEELRFWLDQRNLDAACSGDDRALLFSDRFADKLAADFRLLAPFYRFLMTAEERRPRPQAAEDFAPDPFMGY